MIRLDAILSHAARSDPSRLAVVCGDARWTYGELDDRARRLAAMLGGLGIGHGDRVAFWAANRAEFVEFLFGVPLLGAIAVPLDHWWTAEETLAALSDARPQVLIAAAPQAERLDRLGARLTASGVAHLLALDEPPDARWSPYADRLAATTPLRSPLPAAPGDATLILFTSGSTGRSKGAVHTHQGLAQTALTMVFELGIREGERTLHFLPLFSSCLEHLIPLTLARATHVIAPTFDPAAIWNAIDEHRVSHFDAVPTTLRRLLEDAPPAVPASLRLVSYASEPMPAQLISAWMDRAPHVSFAEFYGMIEHLCLTILKPWEQRGHLGTVGRPMLGTDLRIDALEGDAAGAGEIGEVVVRSPTQMRGYWEDPEATAQIVRKGWFHTGDLGRTDDQGFLVLEGRLKEVIKSGGATVVPREVEDTLLLHPGVREATVVGVPDERWGEAVHAFVVLRPGATPLDTDVQSFCREHLASYKCPKAIHILDELPRTGIGKVARRELRERALASRTQTVARWE